jgi:L-fuconolactonase
MIDTHIHIWDLGLGDYPWLKGDRSILNRSYGLEELEADRIAAGVTEGVLVQAANNTGDTDRMLEAAAAHAWIVGVVGWLPLEDPESTMGILQAGYARNPYFKGVRHLIHNEADPRWLLQDRVLESLRLLVEEDLPYDLVGIAPDHIRTALELAGELPELRMVFDHMNQPPIATGEKYGEWGELMKEAAGHQNFYMKVSGLGAASRNFQGWTTEDLQPYIGFALEQFGEDRCFCGGDWPVSLLSGSYGRVWTAYREIIIKLLGKDGQDKWLHGNARRFYRLQNSTK